MRYLIMLLIGLPLMAGCSGGEFWSSTPTTLSTTNTVPFYAQPVRAEDRPETHDDPTCMMPLASAEERKLATTIILPDPSTAPMVCVLEPNGDDTFIQHYYSASERDQLADYLLYAALLGSRAKTVLTVGVLSGDLKPEEYLLLSLTVGIDENGGVYHPYTRDVTTGDWARHKAPLEIRVARVKTGTKVADARIARTSLPSAAQKPLAAPATPAVKKDETQRSEKKAAEAAKVGTPTPAKVPPATPKTQPTPPKKK